MRVQATATASAAREPDLLDAARNGDEHAFRRLVEPHQAALHSHCYRMLGSLHDAEDALQDALVRAWRGLAGFDGRSSLRTWLHRIATNVCLDAIRRRPKRVLPIDYGPPTGPGEEVQREPVREPVWIEPYPDHELESEDTDAAPEARYEQREAVELAFVAALQHLPAKQRAVLILRDVLGFSAKEVALILETTVASTNGALQRARRAFDKRLPERSQQATLRSLGDARVRDLVERFVSAFEGGDVGAILALLAEDATFEMPPYAGWCTGRGAIADSWLMPAGPPGRLRYVPTRVNGQLALAVYRRDPDAGGYVPTCLDVLAVENGKISEVIAFRSLEAFSRLGLPEELPRDADEAFRPNVA
jgi:RNA polymerase sigma-70 factor (ECF subfamily)